ncbi:MAG: peptidase E [Desulfobulbus sp.]|jgi:dipeptidase E|nr:peptidase E [Desulfobulbus sp.]
MNIVAISGGEIRNNDTLTFDKLNVDLVGKSKVNFLFIPTASYDSIDYCKAIHDLYSKKLGCNVDNLFLTKTNVPEEIIDDKIYNADIVYVGGGNTFYLMQCWKKHNLINKLRNLVKTNKVLTGLSAGAICWHEYGHSDSRKSKYSNYIKVKTLGIKPGIFCPHLDSEQRENDFIHKIVGTKLIGFGCDDKTALWYTDNNRIIVKTDDKKLKIKKMVSIDRTIHIEEYRNNEEIRLTNSST